MAIDKPYKKVPGTIIFDAEQASLGFHLNQFCMSLMKADNRDAFRSDEKSYLEQWLMTEAQRDAVLKRDYNAMLGLGGNIYFLAKIFSSDGLSFQFAAASMTGMSQEDYAQMMLSGGRTPNETNTMKKDS